MGPERFQPDLNGRRASLRTAAAIVIANLVPIAGVLFLGWSAGQILILYWIENFIIGLFTVPRILMARGENPPGTKGSAGRAGTALFFLAHYGLFWVVHGVFAAILAFRLPGGEAVGALTAASFGAAVLAMFVIHGLIFSQQWLRSDARVTATPIGEMFRPYGRLIVLHVTVLLGAFGLSELGAPAWTITLLCLGKMTVELGAELGGWRFRPAPRVGA